MADHAMATALVDSTSSGTVVSEAVLTQILAQLESLTISQQVLQAKLDNLTNPGARPTTAQITTPGTSASPVTTANGSFSSSYPGSPPAATTNFGLSPPASLLQRVPVPQDREKVLYPQRVILTTYPDQTGIRPVPLQWGAQDPKVRGPVVPSRLPASIKLRNAIGAHSGSYSIYRALAIALGNLNPTHKPSYINTEPPVSIPPQPSWSDPRKIVSFDPWGHLVPQIWAEQIEAGLDIRPSIAVTKAHIKLSELDEAARKGTITIDGKLVVKSRPVLNADFTESDVDPGVELACSKAAVEPVWFLPGVAERFKISEGLLRRALFEDTGGMYPELITRPDIKVFLPPIGNLTVYIFGKPEYMSDPSKELTLRVHDECNGSDRGGDSADKYFKSTEMIAGVKDMRFQALMPDVLHWLGIQKIDNMISMSDMKYNAIVQSGIPILKRYDIPDHLIPPDSRVEIDAKIASGYFSSGKVITQEDLVKTVGRAWEETEH
ncbi:hypothetical protein FRC18_007849 [Serendipita sp. 400]|nr:hypothetical protein FRC18_007849 [Serendipita sp. 400]